ncbi:hypothetical protein N8T08_005154 [Aspergillus melleus]|uniref:Uncharacterized protein n=1 Tax=Aspergillus melleus TaxID=138277 RepID=A0ACC3BG68_9EURO|nr:hypothetical protein N8T08_005154 [Aspergillus melleus]
MSCPPSHHTSPEPEIGSGSPPPPTISAFPEASDPKRVALISQIFNENQLSSVDSITWALVWLADLSALEAMVTISSIPYGRMVTKDQLSTDRFPVIKEWLLRFRNPAAKNDDEGTAWSGRPTGGNTKSSSQTCDDPGEATLKRDRHKCIVTKAGEPNDAAHIFGRALGIRHQQKDAHEAFWETLKLFWSTERIKNWHEAVFGVEGTETPKNMMTLNKTVHALWGKARFAFRPIQSTATELKMELHWLPGPEKNKINLCEKPKDGRPAASLLNCRLWDCENFDMIVSGHLITLTTSDPEKMPLPSFAILELQWFLTRVATMSGAADFVEPDDENDDELYGVTSRALALEEAIVPEPPQSQRRARPRQESPGTQKETPSPGVFPSRHSLR